MKTREESLAWVQAHNKAMKADPMYKIDLAGAKQFEAVVMGKAFQTVADEQRGGKNDTVSIGSLMSVQGHTPNIGFTRPTMGALGKPRKLPEGKLTQARE